MSEEPDHRRLSRRDVIERGIAFSAVGLLAGWGCGGNDTSGTGAVSTGKAAPQSGGTLRLGVQGGELKVAALDPYNLVGTGGQPAAVNVFDTLVERTADNTVAPALAESVEPDATGTKWTIRVRDGVTFHDGKPLGADDVVFSLERMQLESSPNTAPSVALLGISRIRKLDDLTVQVELSHPSALLPQVLSAPVFFGIVPVGFDPKTPVGTGPFTLANRVVGQSSDLARWSDYWREGPYLDEVKVTEFADASARVNGLLANQLDVVADIPGSQVQVIDARSDLRTSITPSGTWLAFTMLTTSPEFEDNRVREAFRLLVNRQEMAEQALLSYGEIANDLYGRFDPGYDDSIPQREQDVEKAAALLKEAGKEGATFVLSTAPLTGGIEEASQVLAQQAEAAGIHVKIESLTSGDYFTSGNYLKYPLGVTYWPTLDYLLQAAQTDGPAAFYNETGMNDPEYNDLYRRATVELDETKRNDLIHQMQLIQWESGGYLIWIFPDQLAGQSSRVAGLTPTAEGVGATNLRNVWLT